MKVVPDMNSAMTLYVSFRTLTKRPLLSAKRAFSYALLVKDLETRMPEMLFSRFALISPTSFRLREKASLMRRRCFIAKPISTGMDANMISVSQRLIRPKSTNEPINRISERKRSSGP